MDQVSVRTVQLLKWLESARAGDQTAWDQMLRAFSARFEVLARKMLRKFPDVRRWAETDDVLQGSLVRLMHTLKAVQPSSIREFLGLAALQIRRELLDLARRFHGPHGIGANHHSDGGGQIGETVASPDDTEGLARWQAFHEGVEELQVEEREIVSLVFYHDWTYHEVAELLGVSERTIRRRWQAAMERLHDKVKP